MKAKSGKNSSGRFAFLLFLVFLLLLGMAACLVLLRLQSPARAAVGRWRMELDCTDYAAEQAERWLREAELGYQIDADEYFPPLHVDVLLTLQRDGSWERRLDDESYEAAQKAATEGMAAAARQLLRLRIAATGRGGGPDEYLEQLLSDALGMPTAAYFASCGPQLLPEKEQLRAQHEGAGSWQLANGRLALDEVGQAVDILVGDRLLVLAGAEGTEVYARDDAP